MLKKLNEIINKNIFNKYKKIALVSIFILMTAIFLLPNIIYAQADPWGGQEAEIESEIGLGSTDPRIMVAKVIRIALGFLGIIALVLIIYAGWLWMSSEGNEEKVAQAKKVLKNAIIGLIIILSAFAITTFILNKFMGAASYRAPTSGGGPGSTGGGIGALGSCTLESVYPEPNQKEVPRNTSLVVTFKEEVNPATVAENGRLITDGRVKIYKSVDDPDNPDNWITDVSVEASTDNKMFVFVLDNYLGSPSEYIWYTVYLSNDIRKIDGSGILTPAGQIISNGSLRSAIR